MREILVKKEEFKDSPLGRIPKDWDVNPLSTLGEIVTGTTPPSYVLGVWGDTLPFITPGEISEDGQILNVERSLSPVGVNYVRTVPSQAVLVVCIGSTLGKTALSKEECATNQQINAVIPNSIHDSRFIYAALTYQIDQLLRCAGLQAVPIVNKQQFGKMLIPIAPPDIQRIIAEILDAVDQAIARTSSLIIKLKQTKAGLLQDLLTRGLDDDGKLRDPQAHPEQFKDSPLGRIPQDWEAKPLVSIADLQVGFAFKSEYFQEHDGVKLLRGENVGYGSPDWSETRTLSWKMYLNYREYELVTGDIIIGMDRTFTKSGVKISVLESSDVPALLVQRVGRFLTIECNQQFLKALLSSQHYHNILLAQQKGMDIPHLSKSEILDPLVTIPPIEEQICIASIIETHNTRISTEEAYLNKLKLQKQGLMQDLLTGKVRVKTIK